MRGGIFSVALSSAADIEFIEATVVSALANFRPLPFSRFDRVKSKSRKTESENVRNETRREKNADRKEEREIVQSFDLSNPSGAEFADLFFCSAGKPP